MTEAGREGAYNGGRLSGRQKQVLVSQTSFYFFGTCPVLSACMALPMHLVSFNMIKLHKLESYTGASDFNLDWQNR
jgi:hypothetical protein